MDYFEKRHLRIISSILRVWLVVMIAILIPAGPSVLNAASSCNSPSFLVAPSMVTGSNPRSVATGDFNGDGKIDLVVGNSGGYGQVDSYSLLLGRGDGSFQPAVRYDLGVGASVMFVQGGDFNGTFQSAINYGVGSYPNFLMAGDFNGDGRLDLGVTNGSAPGLVSILLNTCASPRKWANLSLAGGGAVSTLTVGESSVVKGGYSTVAINSGSTPYGTAVFSFSQNGVVVSEAGVPTSPATISGRMFFDYRTGVSGKIGGLDATAVQINPGVNLVNRSGVVASVTFTLRNFQGNILTTGHATLPAGAHRAKFIHELKDIALDFSLPADFSTATQFGSLEITSDQPISMLALRLTTNQRGETLITSTPMADLTNSSSPSRLYFVQLVDGGGYTTMLILLNTSGNSETGTLNLFSDIGTPLFVRQLNGRLDDSFAYSIPPGGVYVFQTGGTPGVVKAGSAQLIPDPSTSTPVGAGVFSYTRGGILVTESGIPTATPTTHARIYVDRTRGHNTALNIAALGSGPVQATLTAFQPDGITAVAYGSLDLNANGHEARFVNELLPSLPADFIGVLDISTSTLFGGPPFVALTLRTLVNAQGDFLMTAFPVADFNPPAPSPLILPQIADGGGYQTRFILLSTSGSPSSTTIYFYDDNGSLIPIG